MDTVAEFVMNIANKWLHIYPIHIIVKLLTFCVYSNRLVTTYTLLTFMDFSMNIGHFTRSNTAVGCSLMMKHNLDSKMMCERFVVEP